MRLRTSVYLVFLALDDAVCADADIDLCVDAERALDAGVARAVQSGAWALHDDECAVLEHVLTAHDTCVTTLTRHRLAELWEHVCAFASSGQPALVAGAAEKMRMMPNRWPRSGAPVSQGGWRRQGRPHRRSRHGRVDSAHA